MSRLEGIRRRRVDLSSMARLLQIFRAGRHVDSNGAQVTFSARELDEIASSYDPAKHEAPIVIGHPRENAPAFGWIQALATRGGALEAVPAQVEPAFAEEVKAGRFKKVSASFYRPDSPSNPTPGKWYLRHVGFLGAQPPAVKGLRAVAFADGDPAEVVELEATAPDAAQASTLGGALTPLRDWLSTTYGPEAAERAIPEATLEADDMSAPMLTLSAWIVEQFGAASPSAATETPTEGEAPTADHAERRARAATPAPTPAERQRAAELAKREAELVRRERELRRTEHVSFLEGLVRDGRPLPAPQEDLLGLLDALSHVPSGRELAFAEGEVRTPEEVLRDLVRRVPRQVDFTEHSAGAGPVVGAAPREVARAAQLHQAELAAKGIHISTTDAVRAVKGGR